jgi:hypothetical protein
MSKEQMNLQLDQSSLEPWQIRINDVFNMVENLERRLGIKPAPRPKIIREILEIEYFGGESQFSQRARGVKPEPFPESVLCEPGIAAAVKKKVQLSLGGKLYGNRQVNDMSLFIHVVDEGSLKITAYNHKDRSVELTHSTYNKAGDGEKITFRVYGHLVVVNVDAKFRTGNAYYQVGDQKVGMVELKECPLNPFEE